MTTVCVQFHYNDWKVNALLFLVIFSDVPDIFLLRMQQPSYIIDLLATIPYDHIALTLHVSEDKGLISLLSARRLLKIQRVGKNT